MIKRDGFNPQYQKVAASDGMIGIAVHSHSPIIDGTTIITGECWATGKPVRGILYAHRLFAIANRPYMVELPTCTTCNNKGDVNGKPCSAEDCEAGRTYMDELDEQAADFDASRQRPI